MAFFLAPLLAKLTASAIGKAAIGGVVSAVASNIGRKTTKPRIDLVGMRNDAMKAGFNPLTVMRSGGMSGYMIPAMSKQSFAGQMLGGAMTNAFDAWANKDIDAYNAEVRKLDLEQRKSDLRYTGMLSKKALAPFSEEPWMEEYYKNPEGYTQMLSVSGKPIEVQNKYLYRLRLRPGSLYGVAEDAEMIFGEIGAEVTGIGNVGDTVFNPVVRSGEITVKELAPSEVTVPMLSKMALEAIGKASNNQRNAPMLYPF